MNYWLTKTNVKHSKEKRIKQAPKYNVTFIRKTAEWKDLESKKILIILYTSCRQFSFPVFYHHLFFPLSSLGTLNAHNVPFTKENSDEGAPAAYPSLVLAPFPLYIYTRHTSLSTRRRIISPKRYETDITMQKVRWIRQRRAPSRSERVAC